MPHPSSVTSTLLTRLREQTRDDHADVERALGLPRRVRHAGDLAAALRHLLAGWRPLERAAAAVPTWQALGLDPHLGAASALLAADLAALGEPLDPAGPDPRPAAPADLSVGVGLRYVLLGSAIGGAVVAPALEARLGLAAGVGTSFFRRSGLRPGADWRAFRAAVAAHEEELDAGSVLRGARRAFATIRRPGGSVGRADAPGAPPRSGRGGVSAGGPEPEGGSMSQGRCG